MERSNTFLEPTYNLDLNGSNVEIPILRNQSHNLDKVTVGASHRPQAQLTQCKLR